MTSIGVTGGSQRDEASAVTASCSTYVAAGRQIDDLARLRSDDGALRSRTRCPFDGSHRELLGWSSFDRSASSLEEGPFQARVPRQLCVALHSRSEAPRFRRYRGTVLGLGSRQTSFGLSRAYYRRATPQLPNALHPRPRCQQSQKCLKVNKIHYFRQIISIIVIVRKLVRFEQPDVKYLTGTIILTSNNLGQARFFIRARR